MTFDFILIFVLICYGMTQILVAGSVFDSIRPKYKFFHCAMCVGFWVGILVYNLIWLVDDSQYLHDVSTWNFWVKAFLMGCLSSGTSYALFSIINDDGIQIGKKE